MSKISTKFKYKNEIFIIILNLLPAMLILLKNKPVLALFMILTLSICLLTSSLLNLNRKRITLAIVKTIILVFITTLYFWTYSRYQSKLIIKNIKSIEGKLIADSSLTSSSSTFYTVHASILGTNDMEAQTSGLVNIILPESEERGLYGEYYKFKIKRKIGEGLYLADEVEKLSENLINKIRRQYLKMAENNIMKLNSFYRSDLDWMAHITGLKLIINRPAGIEDEITELSTQTGTNHIFALSGMHLNIIASFTTFMIKPFINKRKRKFCVFPTIVIYYFFTGRGASLIRAFLMSALSLFRPITLKTAFPLAFILQLLFYPGTCFGASFDYSCCATAGIIVFDKFINFIIASILNKRVANYLSMSVSASTLSFIVALSLNRDFRPIGIILTPIVSILATLILFISITLIIIPGNILSCMLLHYIYYTLVKILKLFAVFSPKCGKYTYLLSILGLCLIIAQICLKFAEKRKELLLLKQ